MTRAPKRAPATSARRLHRCSAATLLLVALAVVPTPARARNPGWDPAPIARFFDDHPWVARDLQRDPALANDARYLEEHRSLREFLDHHPDTQRAFRADPYAALRRTHEVERAARERRQVDPAEIERLDRFLRDHPEVRDDLHANPALVNDPAYLARHPSLRDFLRDQPALRREFQDNPWTFMRRQERRPRSVAPHDATASPRP
ncbi:MAG TPA: hypothetical protein VGK30_12645 [Candidatus Binatia bacterium]|jgi:hypothetical protein